MNGTRYATEAERITRNIVVDDFGCWIWARTTTSHGYGSIKIGNRERPAHRVAYEQFVGPIPDGLQLDHLCRVRRCVNPSHLEPVTQRENILRGDTIAARNAAKTHCPQGHPYDEANTIASSDPRRRWCLECRRARDRRRYRTAH